MRDAASKIGPKRTAHKRTISTKSSTPSSPSPSPALLSRSGTSSSTANGNDPYEQANAKIQEAQRDLLKTNEQAAQVEKRLLEHRAAVLSHAVRAAESLQQQQMLHSSSDFSSSSMSDSSDTQGTTLSGELSPVSTAPTTLSVSSRSKFEGAHLYAGADGAVVPALPRAAGAVASAASVKEIETLKAELTSVQEALESARREIEELGAEMHRREEQSLYRERERAEERQRIDALETELQSLRGETLGERQRAEELEEELQRMREETSSFDGEIEKLKGEKEMLEMDHASVVKLVRTRGNALAGLLGREVPPTPAPGARGLSLRSASLDTWDEDLEHLRDALAQSQRHQDAASSSSKQVSEELEASRSVMLDIVSTLELSPLSSSSSASLPALINLLSTHVLSLHGQLDEHERAKNVWDAEKVRLEGVAKMGMDAQTSLAAEMEEMKKERDELKIQVEVRAIPLFTSTIMHPYSFCKHCRNIKQTPYKHPPLLPHLQ